MSDRSAPIIATLQDSTLQTARLRQVLKWLAVICFVAAPFDVITGLLVSSPPFLIVGVISVGVGAMALLSMRVASQGHLAAAALITASSMFVATLALVVTFPSLLVTLVIVPLLIVALLLSYVPSRMIMIMSLVAVPVSAVVFLIASLLPPLFPAPPQATTIGLSVIGLAVVNTLTLLLLWQFSARMMATLAQAREINQALEQSRADLEGQVARQTADLRGALADVQARAETQARLLDENSKQRNVIREMSVPVLPVSANAIVIPLIGALDTDRLRLIQEQALRSIEQSGVRYLLLDITGVSVVDTQVAMGLIGVVQAARLLGTAVILVGVRPEVAQTVVSLGMDLSSVPTRQSLRDGIAYTIRNEQLLAH